MGQGRKFFIFFNVDMRLGRVFFSLKKRMRQAVEWENVLILGLPIARIFRRKIAVNSGIYRALDLQNLRLSGVCFK